jgi:hypothetical protein
MRRSICRSRAGNARSRDCHPRAKAYGRNHSSGLPIESGRIQRPPPAIHVRPAPWSIGELLREHYRRGAQFLLVLKKGTDGEYTVNWYALGPVNEQLRSEDDAWLLWVLQEAHRERLLNGPLRLR